MTANTKVPVSERAIFTRLSRALKKEGKFLRRCRMGTKWHGELGDYYVIGDSKFVVNKHVDLVEWAKEAGVLHEFEELTE
jgi:hypothetical protein